ncbi:MAG: hypothetical protein EOO19_04645 [Chryseobacterium sp.]|nr:MAG: hypothetical protein EOO19_04645 [Chryseobacterium sp.]
MPSRNLTISDFREKQIVKIREFYFREFADL